MGFFCFHRLLRFGRNDGGWTDTNGQGLSRGGFFAVGEDLGIGLGTEEVDGGNRRGRRR